MGAYPQDYISYYKEGYWGEIGAISLILPQFHAEILAGGGSVGRQQNLRRFWACVIGTPVFFCFNHSCCNAARPLRIRCASTAHLLRIQPFRGVKTTLIMQETALIFVCAFVVGKFSTALQVVNGHK